MQFSSALVLLAVSAVSNAAAIVTKRDGAAVVNEIGNISSKLDVVSADIDAFQGGPSSTIAALKIQIDSTSLNDAINQAAGVAAQSAPFTDDESSAVADAVLTLQPNINTVLDKLVAKEEGFKTAIFGFSATPIVLNTLNQLRNSTATLGDRIIEKLNADFAAIAPEVVAQIDAKFQEAITAFSS